MNKILDKAKRAIISMNVKVQSQPTMREILRNNRGNEIVGTMLTVLITTVLAVAALVAVQKIFNVTIIPGVTDKITGMFN